MQRITLVIAALRCGGAERVAANMANYWARQGRRITIVQPLCSPPKPFFTLDRKIRLLDASQFGQASRRAVANMRALWPSAALRLIGRGHQWLAELGYLITQSKPEVVISFIEMNNLRVLMALRHSPLPVIASEHALPQPARGPAWRRLRSQCYNRANAIVVPTLDAVAQSTLAWRAKTKAIANPLSLPRVVLSRGNVSQRRVLIGMGRLEQGKGFAVLVRAFATIAAQHPDWVLHIWGQGPHGQTLHRLIDHLGLAHRVLLRGASPDAYRVLAQANLFASASRYEAYGNVLWEALACATPVVAVNCPHGPKHIVRHGVDGLLVPNRVDCLARGLSRLMADPNMLQRFSQRAPEVRQRLSLSAAMARWQGLFDDIAQAGRAVAYG